MCVRRTDIDTNINTQYRTADKVKKGDWEGEKVNSDENSYSLTILFKVDQNGVV